MRKVISRIMLIVSCALLAFVVLVAVIVWPKFSNMKSEYVTAGAISRTQAYVQRTQGKWPRSWSDMGSSDETSYTRMNFGLDPKSATKEEVMNAIKPRSGRYYTYPHATEHLEELYNEVVKYRERPREKEAKGVELYSWKDSNGDWIFALLPGTDRLKTEAEIKERENQVFGEGELADHFLHLAEGEWVSWYHGNVIGFEYPDLKVMNNVAASAKKAKVELHLPPEFQLLLYPKPETPFLPLGDMR